MHLVHHAQLHHRILVVVDGLVVETHRHGDTGFAHLHYRRNAITHDEVAARMIRHGGAAPPHELDIGLRHVDGVAVGDVIRHEAGVVEPLESGLAVPA